MFNKATAKLPPRIEKWVMDMQDVDFELVYEPGKDDAYPMDYLFKASTTNHRYRQHRESCEERTDN